MRFRVSGVKVKIVAGQFVPSTMILWGEIRAIRQLFKHRNKRAAAKELFSHELIRKQFISDVTGIPLEEIKSARIGNPYLWRRHRRQKQGIVDILVELNGNTKVNIEIQVKFYSYWDRRNLFYLAKMYTEDLRVGENYEKLKKKELQHNTK